MSLPAACRYQFHGTQCRTSAAARPTPSNHTRRPRAPVTACRSLAEGNNRAGQGSPASFIKKPLTLDEVTSIAAARGFDLAVKELGPLFRVVCREGGPEGRILGITTGWVVPLVNILHCETLQIFTRGMKGEEGERLRGSPLGLGPLLGVATFTFGVSKGCQKAEILAINDDDAWHQRLVRYYGFFGFKPVKVVEGGLGDMPDMLVWGGVGTRMDADMPAMLRRWAPAVRRSAQRRGGAQEQHDEAVTEA